MIPFGPFAPDIASHTLGASDLAEGVIPVGTSDYGPMPSPVVASDALPSKPIGAVMLQTPAGAFTVMAATASHIYRLNTATALWGWDQITTSSLGLNNTEYISFTPFVDKVIAFNGGMTPKIADITSGNATDLGGSPPTAAYGMPFADRVWAMKLDNSPNEVRWSGRDSEDFWTVGRDGADYQAFRTGGSVTGGLPAGEGAFIFQQRGIQYAVRAGATLLFAFKKVVEPTGAIEHASLVQGPASGFFLAESGFYAAMPGGGVQNVGAERVNRWFMREQVDASKLWAVQGAYDEVNDIVFWRYPTNGWASDDYTPRMIGFHPPSGRWVDMPVNLSYVFSSVSPGYTLDSSVFSNIDTMTESLDSRRWLGGRPFLAGFNENFELVTFTGLNMEATLQTADVQLNPDGRSFVRGFRPKIEGTNAWLGRVSTQNTPTDTRTWRDEVTPSSRTGLATTRANGRYHRFQVRIPANENWSVASGIEIPEHARTGQN
ncbi:MAG: hypothetical protein ACE37E_01215 [Hyphomicrobiales bacterium]